MYGAGRRQLRQYLQRHPRAESYFELLSHLRQRPEGAVYDQKPVIERIAGPDRPPRGLLHRWQLGLLDRLITLEARWPWLARRLRKYSPALGASLIDSNPMLCGELEQLRGESLYAAEAILYGDGGELPAMDTSACQLAEDHFARWLAYSDALVECCLFDVKLGGEATTPGPARPIGFGCGDLCRGARRCVNPTLRRAPDGNATEWHWIKDRAVACDRALAFLRREILVLELLCGEKASSPEERTLHELMGLLIAGGDRQARMLRLRLIAAVLHFHAIRGNMPGQSPRLLPTATNWNRLADEVDRCCNDTLRLPAAQLATQPDFAHLPDEAFVVLAARRRFIDVCGHWLAEDLLTARMNCWPGHPQLNDWQRHDSFARGLVRLRTAGPPGGRTYSANLECACNDLRVSRQCSVRALAECIGGRAGNVVSAAANHARRDALAPTLVADRRAVWQKSVIPNLSFPTLGVCPRPNLFARIPTHLAAIAGTAMICILAVGVRKDGWLESIDLRLGGQVLSQPRQHRCCRKTLRHDCLALGGNTTGRSPRSRNGTTAPLVSVDHR